MTYTEIADLLLISQRSVHRYVQLYLSTGNIAPKEQRHGPEPLLESLFLTNKIVYRYGNSHNYLSELEQIYLLQRLIDRPGTHLYELQQQLFNATGTWVHVSTICRTVDRLGFTRTRLQHVALQRCEEMRAEFMADISNFDASMLVWVDETGFRLKNSDRAYGYSLRGMRATDYQL